MTDVPNDETYRPYPQDGRERLILAAPVGRVGTGVPNPEPELFARLDKQSVFMMGDNPALPQMPDQPQLLLHDISNGCFVRSDHGYWGAQMIAPYVDEEIAWAVQYHQALRYIPDESVGYAYPVNYDRFLRLQSPFGRIHEGGCLHLLNDLPTAWAP